MGGRSSVARRWRSDVRNRMTSSKSPLSQNPGLLGSIGLPCASGIRTIKTAPTTHARIFTAGHDTPRAWSFQPRGGPWLPLPSFQGLHLGGGGIGRYTRPALGGISGAEGDETARLGVAR